MIYASSCMTIRGSSPSTCRRSPVLDNVRNGIWLELWGNLTFNPIRALTHATLADNFLYRLGRGLVANRMCEAQTLAVKLGASFRVSLEKGQVIELD